jgi:GNAT superfamily N-acetyltransferase
MYVRLALETEADEVVEMARMNVAETLPNDVFEEHHAYSRFYSYIDTASPTIFVCVDKGKLIGFLLTDTCDFDHKSGFFTVQRVLFVRPEHRGTRAAVLLMKTLIAWSKMLGASEIRGGSDNSFKVDRTAGFLEHFGFEKVGWNMTLRIPDGRR